MHFNCVSVETEKAKGKEQSGVRRSPEIVAGRATVCCQELLWRLPAAGGSGQ